MFGERDAYMMEAVMQRALTREPGSRVLFFVNGLHTLREGGGRVQTGGTRPVEVRWLAARLRDRFPQDVYTILTDATPARVVTAEVATYRGTRAADAMRRAGIRGGSAFVLREPFDDLTRSPVRVVGTTGIDFTLEPRTTSFSTVADAFIYIGDRWRPGDLRNSPYVWLPIRFNDEGLPYIEWMEQWDLSWFEK
jgi:hypothetical protein